MGVLHRSSLDTGRQITLCFWISNLMLLLVAFFNLKYDQTVKHILFSLKLHYLIPVYNSWCKYISWTYNHYHLRTLHTSPSPILANIRLKSSGRLKKQAVLKMLLRKFGWSIETLTGLFDVNSSLLKFHSSLLQIYRAFQYK